MAPALSVGPALTSRVCLLHTGLFYCSVPKQDQPWDSEKARRGKPWLLSSLCGPRWRERPCLSHSATRQVPFPKLCAVNQRLGAQEPKKNKK